MKYLVIVLILFVTVNCSTNSMSQTIRTSSELMSKEGEVVSVEGRLLYADIMKRLPARLQLKDSSLVYIGNFDDATGLKVADLEKYNGKDVVIIGKAYFENIPKEYGIISRLSGPYMVAISNVEEKK